jgi:hypothetical protein
MPTPLKTRLRLAARALLKDSTPPVRPPIPPISPEEVEEARLFFPMEKYFVFGHARSGTTLLARLVRVHPQVHCNWQAHFFTRKPLLNSLVSSPEVAAWLSHKSNRWNRGRDLSPVVLRAVSDFILERDARRLGKSVTGDKSPSSINDGEAVRNLYQVYPDARLVFIVRDGRDAAISHRIQSFVDRIQRISDEDRKIYADFIKDPEPYYRGERSLYTEQGILNFATGWAKNLEETEREASRLFGSRYFHLRYEDLLANPWVEMCKLWSFLGARGLDESLHIALEAEMGANPDADYQKQKDQALAQLTEKGKRGGWRNLFTPRDKQIFRQTAGQALVTWGYEKDLDWE